jgi:DNA-binding NarL/FixJ family response regulator
MPVLESWALHNRVVFELFAGDLTRARELLDRAMGIEMDTDVPKSGTSWLAILIGLRAQDEDFVQRWANPEAIEVAFHTGEPQKIGQTSASFAELYTQRGEHAQSRALLHRASYAMKAVGAAPWFPVAVAMYGDPADLHHVRALLAEWALPADNRAGRAYLALVDAYAARTSGESPVPYAEEAARCFAEIGFSYYQALALELANRRSEALNLYRSAGNIRDTRRLEAALAPVNRRGRSKAALTAREREVASLVAEGKSNRAIAESLFISERTVESHVESIFGKLGVSTRVAVAKYIAHETAVR